MAISGNGGEGEAQVTGVALTRADFLAWNPSSSKRRPGVRHSTFESLRLGLSSQSIASGFLRFWDSLNFKKDREFVGITVLFLDEKFRQPYSEIVRMWMRDVVATTQTSNHRSTSFVTGVYVVHFWIWGAATCVVLTLVLRLVDLPVFGIVDRVRDVSVRIADIGRWELFVFIVVTCCLIYIHRSVPVMLGRTIGSETRQ
ncbi:hypothetical protein F2Q69_00053088 [Brassica cretica]|uniref:Uncharacterized protein n=1 Tax=Brassica cretica TaxID=69181 RepID=A0A8S9N566_BRACR|nr:hypothetical protein F2Q69_00053088 [Brassica cretica]